MNHNYWDGNNCHDDRQYNAFDRKCKRILEIWQIQGKYLNISTCN